GCEPPRMGHQSLVLAAVGHHHGDLGRVRGRRRRAVDGADDRGRPRVVLDPALRVPGAGARARGDRVLRGSVALNGILPANIGTLAMLLMFTAIIAGATFAAILGAMAVQKIFFTLAGTFVYLYLFLTVDGSFDIKFEFVHTHPWATAVLLGGGAYVIY